MEDRNPKRRREKEMRGDLHDGQPWRGLDPKQRTQAKTERQMQREAETDSTSWCIFSLFSSSSSSAFFSHCCFNSFAAAFGTKQTTRLWCVVLGKFNYKRVIYHSALSLLLIKIIINTFRVTITRQFGHRRICSFCGGHKPLKKNKKTPSIINFYKIYHNQFI